VVVAVTSFSNLVSRRPRVISRLKLRPVRLTVFAVYVMNAREIPDILNPDDPQNYRIIENYRLILVVSDYIGHEVLIGSIGHSRVYLS